MAIRGARVYAMRVGSLLRVGWVVLLSIALARCGGIIAGGSDGGDASAGGACSSTSACASGWVCGFPVSQGCSATGQCVPASTLACKGIACGCNGMSVSECGGYATAPFAHTGPCGIDIDSGCDVSGLACELCDVSGYSPVPMAKPLLETSACTPAQITSFVAACFSPNATQQTCTAWQTSVGDAGPCLPCLFTLQSAATWGALVCTTQQCSLNTGGCVDLELNQVNQEKGQGGSGSCGDLLTNAYGCVDYACSTCSTTGTPGSTDFDVCSQSANANECKQYYSPISSTTGPCSALNDDAGPTSRCFPQTDTDVPSFLNVFCGTGQ